MKRYHGATIFELRDMIGDARTMVRADIMKGPGYLRAVPLPFSDGLLARCISAWAVLTGQAYPIAWPEPGDLEGALAKGTRLRVNVPPDTWNLR